MTDYIFDQFDNNKEGTINKEEFLTGMAYFCKAKDEEELIGNVFRLFNITHNNVISITEFKTILNIFPKITHNLFKNYYHESDKKHSILRLENKAVDFYQETEYYTKLYGPEDREKIAEFIFNKYGSNQVLNFEQFQHVLRENVDIMKMFEEVFSTDKWKLSNMVEKYDYNKYICGCIKPNMETDTKHTGYYQVIYESYIIIEDEYHLGNFYKMYAVLYQNSVGIYRTTLKYDLCKVIFLNGVKYKYREDELISKPHEHNTEYMKDYYEHKLFQNTTQNYLKEANSFKIHPEERKKTVDKKSSKYDFKAYSIEFLSQSKDYAPKIYFQRKETYLQWFSYLNKAENYFNHNFLGKIEILEQLGVGAYGVIHKVRYEDGKIYALKTMDKKSLEPMALEAIYNELSIHRFVEHENIVKYLYSFENEDSIYILMEMLVGQDLRSILSSGKEFTEPELIDLMVQMSKALIYLQGANIIHRDLKPENIFISTKNSKKVLKIIDFGLATLDLTGNCTEACGSINYIAPEIYLVEGYNQKVDVWSFGLICYEIIVGNTPWDHYDDEQAMIHIVEDEFDFTPLEGRLSDGLIHIIKGCICKDATERFIPLQIYEALTSIQSNNMKFFDKVIMKESNQNKRRIDRSISLKIEQKSMNTLKDHLKDDTLFKKSVKGDQQILDITKLRTRENIKEINRSKSKITTYGQLVCDRDQHKTNKHQMLNTIKEDEIGNEISPNKKIVSNLVV